MAKKKKFLENTPEQYQRDIMALARAYLLLELCSGGRPVVQGYCCLHCGADNSVQKCKQPLEPRHVQTS